MSAINDLIRQIENPELRSRIQEEVDRMNKQKKFGLVFEEHLPECTPLYDVPVRRGALVSRKSGKLDTLYRVLEISGEEAVCIKKDGTEKEVLPLSDLVTVAEFGEPIYPYLQPLDSVCNAPDSDLWHTLIEADNYHALQLLEYLYAGKVDCIYIDPPYNTGAKDWKYNNDYVDNNDVYRHSKWLSMMQKRLKLAKKLLNPADSVLIVTIDEKEYLHLGCLLEEMFPEANIQMISSVINPSGVAREGDFYRTDEYIFILRFGFCKPSKISLSEEWVTAKSTGKDSVRWRPIRRQGSHDTRVDAPNQFYPIYLSKDGTHVIGAGETLQPDQKTSEIVVPDNSIAIWPIKPDGTEGCWQISQTSITTLLQKGYIKVTHSKKWGYVAQYLAEGERAKVESGIFPILGRDKYGTLILGDAEGDGAPFIPGTQWRISSHSAREQGAALLNRIFPNQRFSFPKSLYAVHDVIRFFVVNNPYALVVDFFAGSGTTLHAVNLLNAEDGGKRRCILVTNNEVSSEEAKALTKDGYHPGDDEWDKLGIARYVTWPRTVCSIKGRDMNGNPLNGNYGVTVEQYVADDDLTVISKNTGKQTSQKIYVKKKVETSPKLAEINMADGFKANAAFFKLGFLDKNAVALGRQFKEMLPTLWLKAGAHGKCPEVAEELPEMLILTENRFAVLLNETAYPEFEAEMQNHPEIETLYIITDSEAGFREMTAGFPDKSSYQLYRDYLDNFRINIAR